MSPHCSRCQFIFRMPFTCIENIQSTIAVRALGEEKQEEKMTRWAAGAVVLAVDGIQFLARPAVGVVASALHYSCFL